MEQRNQYLINHVFNDPVFLIRMIRLTDSAKNYDIRHKLDKIQVPVMVVGAKEDYLTPLVHQRILNNNLSNSR